MSITEGKGLVVASCGLTASPFSWFRTRRVFTGVCHGDVKFHRDVPFMERETTYGQVKEKD